MAIWQDVDQWLDRRLPVTRQRKRATRTLLRVMFIVCCLRPLRTLRSARILRWVRCLSAETCTPPPAHGGVQLFVKTPTGDSKTLF